MAKAPAAAVCWCMERLSVSKKTCMQGRGIELQETHKQLRLRIQSLLKGRQESMRKAKKTWSGGERGSRGGGGSEIRIARSKKRSQTPVTRES